MLPRTQPNTPRYGRIPRFEDGAPALRSLHPPHHDLSMSEASSGNATKSPTAGTPEDRSRRDPNSTIARTTIHAIHASRVVPVRSPPKTPLPAALSSPDGSAPDCLLRKDRRRTLPKYWSAVTSAWRTRRTRALALRRCDTTSSREMFQTQAETTSRTRPNRAVKVASRTSKTAMIRATGKNTVSEMRPWLTSIARSAWRASVSLVSSTPVRDTSPSRCRATAPPTNITRAPAIWARQHRSTSSPRKVIPPSNPPRRTNSSWRTSSTAEGRANTSLTPSCCSWSSSSAPIRSAGTPKRSTS